MVLAVVPSSDESTHVTTTDLLGAAGLSQDGCSARFSGTSAAAPMAAGVVALLLDANPALGWRDVQGVLIAGCTVINPADTDWQINAAGFNVSHKFGFGLIDAGRAVRAAVHWKPMPKYALRIESGLMPQPTELSPGTPLTLTYTVPNTPSNARFIVEHVEVNITIDVSSRGALTLVLTAPTGTVSRLQDVHRDQGAQIANWRYSSIFHWGESPVGNWTLKVLTDVTRHPKATFQTWNVLLHGHDVADNGLSSDFQHHVADPAKTA